MSDETMQASAMETGILGNCRVMLRFALSMGMEISEELRGDISQLDSALTSQRVDPISALPKVLCESQPHPQMTPTQETASALAGAPVPDHNPDTTAVSQSINVLGLALKVHTSLSRLIAPATAFTLEYSEPLNGRQSFFGGMPPLVRAASWIALVCAIGFVLSTLPLASNTLTPKMKEPNGDYWKFWIESARYWSPVLNAFFGAGLGASFYILLSSKELLVSRSYDPKFNAVNIARFVTGVIGGVILAMAFAPQATASANTTASASTTASFLLTPGLLAILGGYAADAVQQMLQRVVDVLLTTVRGDASVEAQGKAKAAQSQINQAAASKLVEFQKETDVAKKQARLDEVFALLKF